MTPQADPLREGALTPGNGISPWMIVKVLPAHVTAIKIDCSEVYSFTWDEGKTEIMARLRTCWLDSRSPIPCGEWERATMRPPPAVRAHLERHRAVEMTIEELEAAQASWVLLYMQPGRYRSPEGVEGTLHGFDKLADRYTFTPDGGPDVYIGRGRGKTAGWTRIGD